MIYMHYGLQNILGMLVKSDSTINYLNMEIRLKALANTKFI